MCVCIYYMEGEDLKIEELYMLITACISTVSGTYDLDIGYHCDRCYSDVR